MFQDLVNAQSLWLSRVLTLLQNVVFRPQATAFSDTASLSVSRIHATHAVAAPVTITVASEGARAGTVVRYQFVSDGVSSVTVEGATEAVGSTGHMLGVGAVSTLTLWNDGYSNLYTWSCTAATYQAYAGSLLTVDGSPVLFNDSYVRVD